MRLSIISFTGAGLALSKQIASVAADWEIRMFTKWGKASRTEGQKAVGPGNKERTEAPAAVYVTQKLDVWAGEQMAEKNALLFIGACGIAVRAIAPGLTDKLHDSPVLVMDEMGHFVIPILSGHVGGANALARKLSRMTGAVPVITTATDLHHAFAVDLFAKQNGLLILNTEGIAKVSSKVLAGEEVTMTVETGHEPPGQEFSLPDGLRLVSYPPTEPVDIAVTSSPEELQQKAALLLKPREYVLGMGCRKNKEPEKIEALVRKELQKAGISPEQVLSLASIDKKAEEPGLLSLCRQYSLSFETYTAEQLKRTEGTFHTSFFVETQVGVDNVCERSALLACGPGGELVVEKQAEDGMTLAIARRAWSIDFAGEESFARGEAFAETENFDMGDRGK